MTIVSHTVAPNMMFERLLLMVLPKMTKHYLLLKVIPDSRLEYKNRETKITKLDILFMAKTAQKPYPLGRHIPI